jgi:Rad3-related DNA helicase
MDAFERVDVVVLAAPTGSGKTLIGETVGRMLDKNRLYVCSSKILQDQFARDYPYARVLKGRSNYPTQLRPDSFHPDNIMGHVSCEDCTWALNEDDSCRWCEEKKVCPYERAKYAALSARVAVLNTSYLLTEANGPGRFSKQKFVIVDEADTLEASLMNHVSIEVSERRLERFKWQPPSRVTVEDSWLEWLHPAIADLRDRASRFPDVFDDVRTAREARYITQLQSKLVALRDGIQSGNWVYTGRGSSDDSRDGRGVSFKPVRVDHIGNDTLWRHSKKWLLMSATIISSDELMSSLGYEGGYETVNVRNTFPVENRRVVYRGSTSMSYSNRANGAWDKVASDISNDLHSHRDSRVLVHTVSYALTEHLYNHLSRDSDRPILRYTNATGRDWALREYLRNDNAVLLAPSMGRGVDLPDDACRVQMITKVPFPYTKDRQINKRMYSQGGRLWYSVQTIRELVQMCGRAIRSERDWAVTYVYDTQFERLHAQNRSLFPDWFREAIIWKERKGNHNG